MSIIYVREGNYTLLGIIIKTISICVYMSHLYILLRIISEILITVAQNIIDNGYMITALKYDSKLLLIHYNFV